MAKAILCALLFFAYPFLIFRGLDVGIAWAAPTLVGVMVMHRALRTDSLMSRMRAMATACLLFAGALLAGELTTKLIPVSIHAFMAWLFGQTLIRGPSLVERMVRLQFPEFPPGVTNYCRQVTLAWTLFFLFAFATCLVLAVFASNFAWMTFNGIIVFVLMAFLAVGEYLYRHKRFPDLDIPSPRDSLDAMLKNGRRVWQDMGKET